jgi:hypothetical protein
MSDQDAMIAARLLLAALGAFHLANAFVMLAAPADWYAEVPGVTMTGPFNPHFVRDIGCAYLTSAGGLLAFVISPLRGRPAALAGSAFLALHGLVHIWDTLAGRASLEHLAQDFVGVLLVPAIALWIAWPARSTVSR